MKILALVIGLSLITGFAFGLDRELNYPETCLTTNDKMEYCYIAQEKLRLAHNGMGTKFREGKITEKEWEDYKNNDFEIKERIIINNLIQQKEVIKKSTKYEVNLNALEKVTPIN